MDLDLQGEDSKKQQEARRHSKSDSVLPIVPGDRQGENSKCGGVTQKTCLRVTREGVMPKSRAKASRAGRPSGQHCSA